ncbi:hypothetical protein pipiens_002369 [Culex pipiens pipiens]|uniref:Uncharacterized protein n=1 Tax=Culex pipiens pipiens TaxID=38569 RepID=A0ABD1DGN3_CULPP
MTAKCDGKILQMSTFSSLIRHFRPIVPIVAFNIMPEVFSCKMFNYSMSDTLSAILSKTYDEQYGGNARHRIRNAAELDTLRGLLSRSDRRTLSTCWTDLFTSFYNTKAMAT